MLWLRVARSGGRQLFAEVVREDEILSWSSKLEVLTVLEESLSEEHIVSLSGSVLNWRFLFLELLPVG